MAELSIHHSRHPDSFALISRYTIFLRKMCGHHQKKKGTQTVTSWFLGCFDGGIFFFFCDWWQDGPFFWHALSWALVCCGTLCELTIDSLSNTIKINTSGLKKGSVKSQKVSSFIPCGVFIIGQKPTRIRRARVIYYNTSFFLLSSCHISLTSFLPLFPSLPAPKKAWDPDPARYEGLSFYSTSDAEQVGAWTEGHYSLHVKDPTVQLYKKINRLWGTVAGCVGPFFSEIVRRRKEDEGDKARGPSARLTTAPPGVGDFVTSNLRLPACSEDRR